jgi:hypothetical protein
MLLLPLVDDNKRPLLLAVAAVAMVRLEYYYIW